MAIEDIFGIWGRPSNLAVDIHAKADTVRKWWKHRRIPEDAWAEVIEAARKRGHRITAQDILSANKPMKPRGRPAIAPRSRRSSLRALTA